MPTPSSSISASCTASSAPPSSSTRGRTIVSPTAGSISVESSSVTSQRRLGGGRRLHRPGSEDEVGLDGPVVGGGGVEDGGAGGRQTAVEDLVDAGEGIAGGPGEPEAGAGGGVGALELVRDGGEGAVLRGAVEVAEEDDAVELLVGDGLAEEPGGAVALVGGEALGADAQD